MAQPRARLQTVSERSGDGTDAPDGDSDGESDQRRLERYLRDRTADGEVYVKSKFIADDLELSPSQIGGLLGRLQDAANGLEVEKWAYTNATTWRVAQRDD